MRTRGRGFTLVEVLVALVVVAMGLAALLVTVSSTARTSGYLRQKTQAQWIALNRITEVRLNANNKFSQNTDTGEVDFAGSKWHYDTRYFDTSMATMKRVVVRVYAGDAKTKGNPLADSTGFLGTALGAVGGSNTDWTAGSTPETLGGASTNSGGAAPATVTPTGAAGNTNATSTGTSVPGTSGTTTTGPTTTP